MEVVILKVLGVGDKLEERVPWGILSVTKYKSVS